MPHNGVYCVPHHNHCGNQESDMNADVVTEFDVNLIPELGKFVVMWRSCAFALDGCIVPFDARSIMKADPNND